MSRRVYLSRQHEEILALTTEIRDKLDDVAAHTRSLSTLLGRLTGKLKVHLAMEDDLLYPALLKHDDAQVIAIAETFADEMGGIRDSFLGYVGKWQSFIAMEQNLDGFRKESEALLTALAARIEREENELYPLLERMES